jgi:hypothetical protein
MYYSLVLASKFYFSGKYFVKLSRVYFEKRVAFGLEKKLGCHT